MTDNLAIGFTWASPEGTRTIDGLHESGLFLVRTEGFISRDIRDGGDIVAMQVRDAASIAFYAEQDAKRAAADAAQAERVAPLTAYLATLPPMQAGKARVSLERSARWPGGRIEPRWKAALRLLAEGYTVEGSRLVAPDGSYFAQDAMTSHGLNFARFHAT